MNDICENIKSGFKQLIDELKGILPYRVLQLKLCVHTLRTNVCVVMWDVSACFSWDQIMVGQTNILYNLLLLLICRCVMHKWYMTLGIPFFVS